MTSLTFRSLKHALHWLFIVGGAIAAAVLLISVQTYVDYVQEGYGIDVSVKEAYIVGNMLYLEIEAYNPGMMELEMSGSGTVSVEGTDSRYSFGTTIFLEERGGYSTLASVTITSGDDMILLMSGGTIGVSIGYQLSVPERDLVIPGLVFEQAGVEVGT